MHVVQIMHLHVRRGRGPRAIAVSKAEVESLRKRVVSDPGALRRSALHPKLFVIADGRKRYHLIYSRCATRSTRGRGWR